MTTEELIQRKRELGYTNEMIAARSGVPLATVQKVFSGTTKSPRYNTRKALEQALGGSPKPAGGNASPSSRPAANYRYDTETISAGAAETGFLREPLPAYKVKAETEIRQNHTGMAKYPSVGAQGDAAWAGSAETSQPDDARPDGAQTTGTQTTREWDRQGEYTLDDYLALPPEQRVELIDGVFYDMAAPGSAHQMLAFRICQKLDAFITRNRGRCFSMMSPLDVRLDCDNKTVVQPDVIVICDREKITRAGITGAPDLVIEVLSASTRKKDMFIKLNKYLNAGVREYWMVDPDRQQIFVYDFAHEQYPLFFTFKDQVPVGIFEGACQIDFSELFDQIRFLYPEGPLE